MTSFLRGPFWSKVNAMSVIPCNLLNHLMHWSLSLRNMNLSFYTSLSVYHPENLRWGRGEERVCVWSLDQFVHLLRARGQWQWSTHTSPARPHRGGKATRKKTSKHEEEEERVVLPSSRRAATGPVYFGRLLVSEADHPHLHGTAPGTQCSPPCWTLYG